MNGNSLILPGNDCCCASCQDSITSSFWTIVLSGITVVAGCGGGGSASYQANGNPNGTNLAHGVGVGGNEWTKSSVSGINLLQYTTGTCLGSATPSDYAIALFCFNGPGGITLQITGNAIGSIQSLFFGNGTIANGTIIIPNQITTATTPGDGNNGIATCTFSP